MTSTEIENETETAPKKRPGRAGSNGAKPLYRVVTNPSQMAEPRKFRTELCICLNDLREDGAASAFWVREMDAGEHNTFELSDKIFDKNNQITGYKLGGGDFRFLKHCLWDSKEGGQPLFATYEAAEAFLKPRGRSFVNQLVVVANKVNYGTGPLRSIEQVIADAEGNSGATSTSDSPSS